MRVATELLAVALCAITAGENSNVALGNLIQRGQIPVRKELEAMFANHKESRLMNNKFGSLVSQLTSFSYPKKELAEATANALNSAEDALRNPTSDKDEKADNDKAVMGLLRGLVGTQEFVEADEENGYRIVFFYGKWFARPTGRK